MSKTKKAIAAVFVFIFMLLPGCQSGERPSNGNASPPVLQGEIEADSTALRFISRSGSGMAAGGGYAFWHRYDGDASLLYRLDFGACEQGPLCDVNNCTHDDDSCGAWVDLSGGAAYFFADETNLYRINSCSAESGRTGLSIVVSDFNNANSKELAFIERGALGNAALASDDKNVYILVDCTDTNEKWLYQIPLDGTGAQKTANINSESKMNDVLLLGTTGDDRFVLFMNTATDSSGLTWHSGYYSLSVRDGSLNELYGYDWSQTDSEQASGNKNRYADTAPLMKDEKLYHLRRDGVLVEIEPIGWVETELLDVSQLGWQRTDISDVWDGYVVLTAHNGDGLSSRRYAYNIETKELKRITISELGSALYQNAGLPIAEYGDNYLIVCAIERYKQDLYGTDGTPYSVDLERYIYALISKTDYWNGAPNYRDITEMN